jgi:tetratricopeptide (TPR) repeat protein
LNQGKEAYLHEVFEWYKKGFTSTVFIKNGELSRFTYNNVAIAGLKLGEFEWTKSFLETNKKYISKMYQDDTYYFNLALWHQYQNQYDEVLKLLLQVNFKDILHGLHAKQLMAKIYYEMNAFNALESLLGSIKVYLHRHKELGYHRQDYLKLIKYLKKLIQLNQNNKTSKEQLLAQINQESTLLDKAWFIRQLEK